jgi:hypothetical protein
MIGLLLILGAIFSFLYLACNADTFNFVYKLLFIVCNGSGVLLGCAALLAASGRPGMLQGMGDVGIVALVLSFVALMLIPRHRKPTTRRLN